MFNGKCTLSLNALMWILDWIVSKTVYAKQLFFICSERNKEQRVTLGCNFGAHMESMDLFYAVKNIPILKRYF